MSRAGGLLPGAGQRAGTFGRDSGHHPLPCLARVRVSSLCRLTKSKCRRGGNVLTGVTGQDLRFSKINRDACCSEEASRGSGRRGQGGVVVTPQPPELGPGGWGDTRASAGSATASSLAWLWKSGRWRDTGVGHCSRRLAVAGCLLAGLEVRAGGQAGAGREDFPGRGQPCWWHPPHPQRPRTWLRSPQGSSDLSSLCAPEALLTLRFGECLAETPWSCGRHGRRSGLWQHGKCFVRIPG